LNFILFSLQPHAETKAKQITAWKNLILNYFRVTNQAILDIRDIHNNPLFNNSSIDSILNNKYFYNDELIILIFLNLINKGKLPSDVVLILLEELAKSGNANYLDKSKQRWIISWHTLEEWASIIYSWAQENGFIGSVCTFYELTQGEDTANQGK
jgi:hypothetical protein